MREDQIDQAEREATMRNDADVRRQQREAAQREQSGTFFSHTHADEISGGGRFAAVNPATVVGQDPQIKYPQLPASSPWSGAQPEPGIEPPLGFENSALNEILDGVEWSSSIEATGGAPSPSPCEDVVAPPSSKGTDNG
jgi:hypothetical protein